MATVTGGVHSVVHALTAAERSAAFKALSKLSNSAATKGLSSVLGGGLKSATLSGGTLNSTNIKLGKSNLITGKGSDTFAGGVSSGAKPVISTIGSDTVVSGSAFSKTELTVGGAKGVLAGDTINIAGTTAATLKQTLDVKSTGHTITMADKTSITLKGIPPHKPH